MKRPVSKTRCPVVAAVLCVSSAVPPEVLLLEGDKREGRLRCQNESEGVDGGVVEEQVGEVGLACIGGVRKEADEVVWMLDTELVDAMRSFFAMLEYQIHVPFNLCGY